jgi:calcium binding protein 39
MSLSNDPLAQSADSCSYIQDLLNAIEASTYTDAEKAQLFQGMLDADLPARALEVLPSLEFEAQKNIMRLFHKMVLLGAEAVFEYVRSHHRILQLLLDGCGNVEVALHCHTMLQSCTLHSDLVVCMLEAGFAMELLKLAQHQSFDISADAFYSLRALLLTHKPEAAAYLEAHFKDFFVPYNELLQTADYVAKRQGLRLLGNILLDRKFTQVLNMYVWEGQFLQVTMNLLRDSSKAVQADAFHVFKVFAVVPHKRSSVRQILLKNRDRLVKLLDSLGQGCAETFLHDQSAVIVALWALESCSSRKKSAVH